LLLVVDVSTNALAIEAPQEMRAKTRNIILKAGRDGNLVVSSGSVSGDICPLESIRAMIGGA
jgi:hypothetical protein